MRRDSRAGTLCRAGAAGPGCTEALSLPQAQLGCVTESPSKGRPEDGKDKQNIGAAPECGRPARPLRACGDRRFQAEGTVAELRSWRRQAEGAGQGRDQGG